MNQILLGSNAFVDCHTLVSLHARPMLRVEGGPLRVSLALPAGAPSGIEFDVFENKIMNAHGVAREKLRVVAQETSVAVFWGDMALVIAVVIDATSTHLRVDLRPVGVSLYDDAAGLHVGKNTFSGNKMMHCATAIALG
jgi:hypothetical protein